MYYNRRIYILLIILIYFIFPNVINKTFNFLLYKVLTILFGYIWISLVINFITNFIYHEESIVNSCKLSGQSTIETIVFIFKTVVYRIINSFKKR